jgi:hypothetical protein
MKLIRLPAAALALILAAAPAFARLGETEAQSKVRYGEEQPDLIGANDKPLLEGAKEAAFFFQGWRVRAAFINGVTHKIEYAKLVDGTPTTLDATVLEAFVKQGGPRKIKPEEITSILEAEKGQATYRWREVKPRTGNDVLDALKKTFDGRVWERSDKAQAKVVFDLVIQLESRDADKLEKQLAKAAGKTPGKATPAPGTPMPKF